jgi:hypothetical protein
MYLPIRPLARAVFLAPLFSPFKRHVTICYINERTLPGVVEGFKKERKKREWRLSDMYDRLMKISYIDVTFPISRLLYIMAPNKIIIIFIFWNATSCNLV